MSCRDVQEEIASRLLTGTDLDDETSNHVATCPECAGEQASLRQVLSIMGSVATTDIATGTPAPPNELHLRRILDAAAAERAQERRRTRSKFVAAAAAAAVAVILGIGVGNVVLSPDRMITASASAAGLSATADISPHRDGSQLHVAVTGVPPDTDCVLLVRTTDGRSQPIAEWRAEYEGTAHVSATTDAAPDAIEHVTLTKANGSVLLDIPVTG